MPEGQDGPTTSLTDPEAIAQLVLTAYDALPRNVKPILRPNGVPEWTILAGLVVSRYPSADDGGARFKLISIGTGVKCLPTNRLPPCGDTLHDSHAEILARRGFLRWLWDEALSMTTGGNQSSEWLMQGRGSGNYQLRDGVRVHMYISALPCGNASSLHTAAHQPRSMAALKSSSATSSALEANARDISDDPPLRLETARGRNGYTDTISLRTKPGRPDSFPSISMSCSDKLASWNVLGLQGGLLARCFDPVYLDSIVIGGAYDPPRSSPHGDAGIVGWEASGDEWRRAIQEEASQALYGRLEMLDSVLPKPYRLNRPAIHLTPTTFSYDKPTIMASHPGRDPVPQPTSVLQYATASEKTITENLFQGCDRRMLWKPPGLEPLPQNRRSGVCKLEMLRAAVQLEQTPEVSETAQLDLGNSGLIRDLQKRTYHDWKHDSPKSEMSSPSHGPAASIKASSPALAPYQLVKRLLRGVPGEPRIRAGFEKCGPLVCTQSGGINAVSPPFAGWIVSGCKWESFDSQGYVHREAADPQIDLPPNASGAR